MSIVLGGQVASGGSGAQTLSFQGHPCTALSLPSGDRVLVAHFGAQVLSWTTPDGRERLYLSPNALSDGTSPIRGGVPVCFPQFNMRAIGGHTLPKHGLVRTLPWVLDGLHVSPVSAGASFKLRDTEATRALWPYGFSASLVVCLYAGRLSVEFSVRNRSDQPFAFALALHTYLRVDDVAHATLGGLSGLRYWDAVEHLHSPGERKMQSDSLLTFGSETDRVYEAVKQPLRLSQPCGALRISQSDTLPEAVVWNPGAALCAALPDMPSDGWQQMLCVEAACVNTPVLLAPGASWTGWQDLSCEPVA